MEYLQERRELLYCMPPKYYTAWNGVLAWNIEEEIDQSEWMDG